MSQTMADIKQLSPVNRATENYDQMHRELQELKPLLRKLAMALAPLEAEYERLFNRKRLLPGDRKLGRELKLVATTLADARAQHADVLEQVSNLKLRIERVLVERRAAELRAESMDYDFLMPFQIEEGIDDPLVVSTLMSSICESLQYQYVSGNRYYHWLIDQVAKRGDNGEVAHGDLDNTASVPEIEHQWNEKLDTMRKKREYLTVLRFAAERAFRKAVAEVPHDAPYTPKMLRKTDEELEDQINQRKRSRWQDKQDTAQKVADAEHSHAKREDRVYSPRL